jgi:hypothetical protein
MHQRAATSELIEFVWGTEIMKDDEDEGEVSEKEDGATTASSSTDSDGTGRDEDIPQSPDPLNDSKKLEPVDSDR